ncbi:hypothetical protein Tco_0371554 [Tanacetum coccineum]
MVVDVFIPFKKSKAGKRFAFVRFIKVFNLDRLVENLCTIWIDRFHLFANHVHFDRPQKPNHSPPKVLHAHKNSFSAFSKKLFHPKKVKRASVEPAIILDDSCIKEFDFNLSLMGKVNEVPIIPNLPVLIAKEGFDAWVPDFEDYDDSLLLEKPKEILYPVSSNCAHPSSSRTRQSKKKRGMTTFQILFSCVQTKAGVSILDLMDSLVNVGRAMGYKMDGCFSVISIYAPQELSEKRDLWNYLQSFISRWDGETGFLWVFNEGVANVKDFVGINKNLSDHSPILLRESCLDYGPTPFRFFHSWFSLDGFDAFMENTWNSLMVSDDNALIRLQRKLQLLKIAIKSWTKEFRLKSNAKKCQIQQDILCLDKLFDLGLINDDSLNKRALLLNELHEINSVNASELSQKAEIRWSIEGDENSKFFHGIINKKRAQLAIRGILADDYEFHVRLTSDQVEDLESEISNEEVKAAA